MKFQAIKGVRDILPPESALWNRVEQTAREVFGTFGFAEIRLPIFEQTELFARSIGDDTDVVGKEMYKFEDWPAGLDSPRTRIFASEEISRLEDAMAKGELPNSESNQKALSELRKFIGEMDAEQTGNLGSGETPTAWLAGFRKIVSEYVWQAQFLQGRTASIAPGSDRLSRSCLHRARDAGASPAT